MKNEKTISQKVTSYESACKLLKVNPKTLPVVKNLPANIGKSIIAFYKLTIIAKALNGGWVADFTNANQYKYYPYFEYKNNIFSYYFWHSSYCNVDVSVHLLYKDSETAIYAGNQFKKLYNDYLKQK